MSQNMSDLRLQKYGFFYYGQPFLEKFFLLNCNCLIINKKIFINLRGFIFLSLQLKRKTVWQQRKYSASGVPWSIS